MLPRSLDDCLSQLRRLGQPETLQDDSEVEQIARAAAAALIETENIDEESVAQLVRQHPDWIPVLASCVGLGREQLKRQLQYRLGTAGWVKLAKSSPHRLVHALEEAFGLLEAIREQKIKSWSFADVLVERARWSHQSATRAGRRGRALENVVQQIVREAGLPCKMRTTFTGKRHETAPCDVAIPAGGQRAKIIIAVKGFDSTGSKLSDAVREIQQMVAVRLPRHFVFAFVDGIGWLGRRRDYQRIHELWVEEQIDGLYSLATREQFLHDLRDAGRRLDLP